MKGIDNEIYILKSITLEKIFWVKCREKIKYKNIEKESNLKQGLTLIKIENASDDLKAIRQEGKEIKKLIE